MIQWVYRQLWRTDLPAWFFLVAFFGLLIANAVIYPLSNEFFAERNRLRDAQVEEAKELRIKALEFEVSLLAMLNPMLTGTTGSDVVPEPERTTVLNNIAGLIGILDGIKAWLGGSDLVLVERYQGELSELHDALLDLNDFMSLRRIYPVLDEIAKLHTKLTIRLREEIGVSA